MLTVLLFALCVSIAIIDLERFRIPNALNSALAIIGIVALLEQIPKLLILHTFSAGIAFLLTYLISEIIFRRTGKDWLGIGDAKFIGAATIWIGPFGLPSMLLIASLTAIPYALLVDRQNKGMPFGPFLCLGLISVWLHGPIML